MRTGVAGVALFWVVGMGGVAVVGAQHKSCVPGAVLCLPLTPMASTMRSSTSRHERSLAPYGSRADFFIVEHRPDVAAGLPSRAAAPESPSSVVSAHSRSSMRPGHEDTHRSGPSDGLLTGREDQVASRMSSAFTPASAARSVRVPLLRRPKWAAYRPAG